ncbi:TetR/AcrR family transcriptional regulator [Micromonospora phytophila]|uniref:TetR/AcrR family transcriptional regulator n=1 Tax=Micromonospora phytophila TaxID=709888 RepID=UPI00202E97A5|nr:TetR/AcrR family transcriptional regulator [Micromonospora phytophila]MCM0674518.1 TetR/AcrR family transcriptional regulator [Micromonospora phytophila]
MTAPIGVPQNTRSRRTREALLQAARSLIEEDGFDVMTLSAVADRAGVSRRALYLHFASRSELLTTLYRHLGEAEDLATSLAKVWAQKDAVGALDEWARHIARSHPRILTISRVIERARNTDEDAAELWHLTMRNWLTSCRRLANWLDKENRLADPWTPSAAADMLWALMSWDVTERLIVDRRWSRKTLGSHYAAMLHATFVRDSSPHQ